MGQQMSVNGTAGVVAGEYGFEGDDAVVVSQLNTAEIRAVQATLARGVDTRVDTGCIAVPNIDSDVWNSFAGAHVYILDFEEKVDSVTILRLNHIRAEVLASNIVRSVGDLGSQDAAGVGAEDFLQGSEFIIVVNASLVVVDSFPGLEVCKVSAILAGS